MKQVMSDETVERLHVEHGWSRAAIRTVEDAIMLAVVKERESAKYTEAEGGAFADGYFTAIVGVGKDAERYRKLRAMTWDVSPLGVVSNPRQAVKLGHDCPMGERLDAMLDALP